MDKEQKERIKKYFDTAEYSLHLFDNAPLSNDDRIYQLRKSVIALYNILKEQYLDIDVHSISIK